MAITGPELDKFFSDQNNNLPPPLSTAPSTNESQKAAGSLKAYLQRANFDPDIGFTTTSPASSSSSKPKARPFSSQAKTKAEAKSSPVDSKHAVIKSTEPVVPSPLTSEASRYLLQARVITKEYSLPVHLLSHTLRSTSLNSTQQTDDMGGPGLQSSRFARESLKNGSYNSSVTPKFPSFPVKPTQAQPPAPASNGSNAATGNRTLITPTPSDSVFATPLQYASEPTRPVLAAASSVHSKENAPFAPAAPIAPAVPSAASVPVAPIVPTDHSVRLAQLKAKRAASKMLANSTVSSKADTIAADTQARVDAENEAARAKAAQIASAEAERLAEEKAEADRLEAQRIAKEKAEAERRAKIQAELDVVLETIQKLEAQEQARIIAHDKEAMEVKVELTDATAQRDGIQDDKTEADRLVQDTEEELAEVEHRLSEVRKKATDVQVDLDEAHNLVTGIKGTLAKLDAISKEAVQHHEQALTALTEKKHVLEKNYDHYDESTKDLPAPSATPAVAPMEVFDAVPVPDSEPSKVEPKPAEDKPEAIAQNGNLKGLATNGVNKGFPTLPEWPKVKPRAPSVVRSVRLENLPTTYTNIGQLVRLVFHGALHSIRYEVGKPSAEVTFLKAGDCKKYLDATENGIPDPNNPARTIITKPCAPESGEMEVFQIMINKNLTRNIRIVGISMEWKLLALKRMAEGSGRKIERLFDGHHSSGSRVNDFRFCKIADAVTFKSEMEKDEDFHMCQIAFSADPCAVHQWVHDGVVNITN